MDGLLLASITFLCTVFAIILGFVFKLWFDERNAKVAEEMLRRNEFSKSKPKSKTSPLPSSPSTERKNKREEDEDENVNEDFEREDTSPKRAKSKSPSSDEDAGPSLGETSSDKKIGKKKMAKLQAKAEAKVLREQQLEEREAKKRREEEAAQLKEEKRLAEEEEERQRNEKLKKEKEEREKQEREEYLKFKESFNVNEQGFDNENNEVDDPEEFTSKLLEYLRKRKVVHVDQVASNFQLKPEIAIERINGLLKEKLISGVFDDRVAKFINQRGRVTLSEIAENSTKLISFVTPSD
uniref:DDRGK domain-containing protein 1 n=1 Tax=Meloidogyne hapla TaxID=6305 RepID=A0A1I8B381_MELHA